jgi:hypothetical protein
LFDGQLKRPTLTDVCCFTHTIRLAGEKVLGSPENVVVLEGSFVDLNLLKRFFMKNENPVFENLRLMG